MERVRDGQETPPGQRVDKWLWFARLLKTRSLARALAESGRIRLSRAGAETLRVTRASQTVKAGDVLTFPLGARVRVVRVNAPGVRRGPPAEARDLYQDLAPAQRQTMAVQPAAASIRAKGSGRPTKKERRALDRLKDSAN
jgi:ribosome-associated heat shock protein Hsp15